MEYEITNVAPHENGLRIEVTELPIGNTMEYNFGADWLVNDRFGTPRWKAHLDQLYVAKDDASTKVNQTLADAQKFLGRQNPAAKLVRKPAQ